MRNLELATRQCSMKVIEILKKNFTQLIEDQLI